KHSDIQVCGWSQAVPKGKVVELGHGPSPPLCQFSTSTVQFV
ncbi:hypothetical protein PybrP1_008837, partial [[Pythium] brassicae (nom. inval.)]